MGRKYTDEMWKEAKKNARLNSETIEMAKELGLNPESIVKNIPGKDQQWKAPVHEWIRDMYEERFGMVKKAKKNAHTEKSKGVGGSRKTSDELPF